MGWWVECLANSAIVRAEGVAALGLRRQAGLGFAWLPLRFPWPDPADVPHGK